QRQRLVDQVLVVEQAAPILLVLVAPQHGVGDGQQRAGALAAVGSATAREQRTDARLFGLKSCEQARMVLLNLFGSDTLSRLEIDSAEDREVVIKAAVGACRDPAK